MLNIISIQALRKKSTGPSKLAKNLIKGLDLIGEPYIINGDPNIFKNIYIIDDEKIVDYIHNFPKDAEIFLGPIIMRKKEQMEKISDRYTFIYPSNRIKNIGDKFHRHKNSICWPVGIDTYEYNVYTGKKFEVLVYLKRRGQQEVDYVLSCLDKLGIKYNIIDYCKGYSEKSFIEQLKRTKYVIRLGGSETQGIALEEILSMDIPVLVRDIKKVVNYEKGLNYSDIEKDEFATSAAYFDNSCGVIFYDKEDVEMNIKHMEECYKEYKPREYILNNLSLEKQARELLSYYKDSKRGNNIRKPKFILKNILIKIGFIFIDSKIGRYISPLIFKIYTFYLKIFVK